MKFYTVQTIDAINVAFKTGFLSNNKKSYWKNPYDWMRDQMIARIVSYIGGPIIWLFDKNVDTELLYRDNDRLLLEVSLDKNKVLPSDFEYWHYVLNNWKIEGSEKTKEESWNKIFDLSWCRKQDLGVKQIIQYTTGEIPIKDIKIITEKN